MKVIDLKVGLFPACCGAKLIWGFPDWWPEERVLPGSTDFKRYQEENRANAEGLEYALKRLFDVGGKYFQTGSSETYRYEANVSPGGSLGYNAFIFAITNHKKDRLAKPILEKYGFKYIAAEKNPNSNNIVYTYMWRWSETRDNQNSLYPLSSNKIKVPLAEPVDAGVLKTPDTSRGGSIPSGDTNAFASYIQPKTTRSA